MKTSLALILCVLPLPAVAQEVFFQSPSGNIHCAIFDGSDPVARCDLLDFTASFARPADCDLDFGHAFEVHATGAAEPICAGDTVAMPDSEVLDYGQEVTYAGITCASATTGMTCRNGDGRGFTLTKARQRLF